MSREQQPTTVAILGANAVVENALAQLLKGEGYATRVLKPFPLGGALEEEPRGRGSRKERGVAYHPRAPGREIEELLLEARFPAHRESYYRKREGEIPR
jgi:hypothetical protein